MDRKFIDDVFNKEPFRSLMDAMNIPGPMQPKGYVMVDKKFEYSNFGPFERVSIPKHPDTNLAEEYKKALALKMVKVMDIAVDESSYLVLQDDIPEGILTGPFMFDLDARDCISKGLIPWDLMHPNPEEKIKQDLEKMDMSEFGL